MLVKCQKCERRYDDADQWAICPHGPIGFPVDDYCPRCDTLRSVHGACQHQKQTPPISPTVGPEPDQLWTANQVRKQRHLLLTQDRRLREEYDKQHREIGKQLQGLTKLCQHENTVFCLGSSYDPSYISCTDCGCDDVKQPGKHHTA